MWRTHFHDSFDSLREKTPVASHCDSLIVMNITYYYYNIYILKNTIKSVIESDGFDRIDSITSIILLCFYHGLDRIFYTLTN